MDVVVEVDEEFIVEVFVIVMGILVFKLIEEEFLCLLCMEDELYKWIVGMDDVIKVLESFGIFFDVVCE